MLTYLIKDFKNQGCFIADPDPAFYVNVDSDPVFTLNRIRTQFLFKIMGICGHWSTDPPGLHFEPLSPRLWESTVLHGSILSL